MRVHVEQQVIELSRSNLLGLLAKLDGHPPNSRCTIGQDGWWVRAVEDSEHYADRTRGVLHPQTEDEVVSEQGREQARADRIRQRGSRRKCRWCDKPGPYYGRCADHWDTDEENVAAREPS